MRAAAAKVTKRSLDKLAGEQKPALQMRMDPSSRPAIVVGLKTQTTRRGIRHHHRGQRLDFVFVDDKRELEDLPVVVTGVHFRTLLSLTAADAVREGLDNVTELQIALMQHYPGLRHGDVLTCIHFRRETCSQ